MTPGFLDAKLARFINCAAASRTTRVLSMAAIVSTVWSEIARSGDYRMGGNLEAEMRELNVSSKNAVRRVQEEIEIEMDQVDVL